MRIANSNDLARELRAEGEALVKKHEADWAKILAIDEEWTDLRHRWRPLIERSGLDDGFPESPLANRAFELGPPVPKMILNGEKFARPSPF